MYLIKILIQLCKIWRKKIWNPMSSCPKKAKNKIVTTEDVLKNVSSKQHDKVLDTFIVKIIKTAMKERDNPILSKVKKRDAEGVKERGIWRVSKLCNLPTDANIIGARFVLTLKTLSNSLGKTQNTVLRASTAIKRSNLWYRTWTLYAQPLQELYVLSPL